jgi:hypothetical protein
MKIHITLEQNFGHPDNRPGIGRLDRVLSEMVEQGREAKS